MRDGQDECPDRDSTEHFSERNVAERLTARPRAARIQEMPKPKKGRRALFRGKVRAPVSITLTKRHHAQVKAAAERLGVTRADLIGLLIERYADLVKHQH